MNIQKQLLEMNCRLKNNKMSKHSPFKILLLFIGLSSICTYGQAEFTTWGNLTGIRVDNQLMEFNTSLALVNKDGNTWATRKEGQGTDFKRDGKKKIFTYEMGENIAWENAIETVSKDEARVAVQFMSKKDTLINGAYFRIELPEEFGEDAKFQFTTPESITLKDMKTQFEGSSYQAPASGITISSLTRQLNIQFAEPTEVIIKAADSLKSGIVLNMKLTSGAIKANEKFNNTFTIKASGEIDKSPLKMKLFPEQEGRKFDGVGGNFRLQNPKMDPQVIDYSLKNLRVAWSRVEMPWRLWHPDENKDPIAEAKKGNIDPKVKASLEMAQRLDKMGIPVILAAWFAPDWVIIGERARGVNLDGSRGNALDQTKKDKIYESLTSYIKYLKDEYGVETVMFSFNESDLGIDVRQTPEEHNMLIKELGAHLRKQGLKTEFLLGDTADANGWEFTTLASMDPETRPYIGAVSFHSWRGWTDENLIKWKDIANRVDVPLFVGEGSIDAGAWRYPQIFEEPTYALDEIDVYMKILNISQPISILQWQLTSDYSVLSGGGIFGNDKDDLYPTQRFFNLKQLGSTPQGLKSIPITTNKNGVTSAAFGDMETGKYAIHIVNKGASRTVELSGLPENLTSLNVFLTNKENSFKKVKTVSPSNGKLTFDLEGASYVSLMTE